MDDQSDNSLRPYLEPSPESFLPAPKLPPTGFERPPQLGSWQLPVFFGLAMAIVSFLHWGHYDPVGFAVGSLDLQKPNAWWHFVSALFAHGDFDHLIHNLPPFLLFGWLLRGYFGTWAFPVLSLIAGVGANIATIYSYAVSEEAPSSLLGASGMVYAMVGIWLVLYMAFESRRSIAQRGLRAVGFGLALFFPKTFEPRVSYMAHLSGFVIGAVLAFLCIPLFRRTAPMLKNLP